MSINTQIIENVLRREGDRFVVEASTCSKFGITLESLADWRGTPVTTENVKRLTRDEAVAFYTDWMRKYRFAEIGDPLLRELVFDSAVNHGPARGAKWLQRALDIDDDGVIGPLTLAALEGADARAIYRAVLRRRVMFYGVIISTDHRQAIYAEGWLRRAAEFIR